MRRLLAGLLSLGVTAVVGGAATVMGLMGCLYAAEWLGSPGVGRSSTRSGWWELLSFALLALVVLLAAGVGARAGEWTLARLGFPLSRPDGMFASGLHRISVTLVAFLSGYFVGLGWGFLWWAALDEISVIEFRGMSMPAHWLVAAGPALGLAMVRAVMRRGLRAPDGSGTGEGGGAAPGPTPRTVDRGA